MWAGRAELPAGCAERRAVTRPRGARRAASRPPRPRPAPPASGRPVSGGRPRGAGPCSRLRGHTPAVGASGSARGYGPGGALPRRRGRRDGQAQEGGAHHGHHGPGERAGVHAGAGVLGPGLEAPRARSGPGAGGGRRAAPAGSACGASLPPRPSPSPGSRRKREGAGPCSCGPGNVRLFGALNRKPASQELLRAPAVPCPRSACTWGSRCLPAGPGGVSQPGPGGGGRGPASRCPHPADPGAQEAMGGGVKVVTPRLLCRLPTAAGHLVDATRLVSQLLFQGVLLDPHFRTGQLRQRSRH